MNEPKQTPPAKRRFPTLVRFGQWLTSWRTVRRALIGIASIVTLIALLYAVENWRGKRAWEKQKRELQAQGVVLRLADLAPPPVPDDQNFAMTPFLKPVLDLNPDPKPGESRWRDTNGFNYAQEWGGLVSSASYYLKEPGNWRLGKTTDLAGWLESYRKREEDQRILSTRRGRTVDDPVTPVEQTEVFSRRAAAAEIIRLLKDWQPELEELRAAANRPHSRFNLQYEAEDPFGILLPHASVLRKICHVLEVQALAHLALKRSDPVFEDLKLMVSVADSLRDEPFVVSQLVRMACLHIAVHVLWEGLADRAWTEDQLRQFQKRFETIDLFESYKRAVAAEQAAANSAIELVRRKPRILDNMLDNSFVSDGLGSPIREAAYQMIPRGWWYLEQVNYNRAFDEWVVSSVDITARRVEPAIADANAELLKAIETGRHPSVRSPFRALLGHRFLWTELLTSLGGLGLRVASMQSMLDQAVLACALERYRLAQGNYPETLEDLVPRFAKRLPHDVVNGESLKYRRTDEGQFVLYSIGWNLRDDGGEVASRTEHETQVPDLKNGDWVWSFAPVD